LRNASDQFFEYAPAQPEQAKSELPKVAKRRPRALLAAVALLAAETAEGRVGLGALGQYMRRTDPGFSPQLCGHTGLLDMVQTYPDLVVRLDNGGHWVQPKPKADASKGSLERPIPA
jgi:hypothetical protein